MCTSGSYDTAGKLCKSPVTEQQLQVSTHAHLNFFKMTEHVSAMAPYTGDHPNVIKLHRYVQVWYTKCKIDI